jgi:hypothetical protein
MKRVALSLCVLVLAGCGGGGGGGGGDGDRLTLTTPKATASPSPSPSPSKGSGSERPQSTGPVTAAEKRVIRDWANALRRGDVERAVSYWTVPAIAANGTQPVRLLTRDAIRQWNDSLPCGAKLKSVERDSNYVLATFVLTNRKGVPNGCGSGVGNEARTVFLIRGGKIAQWIRAPDPTDATDDPSGSTS